jgi:hypothetical protein
MSAARIETLLLSGFDTKLRMRRLALTQINRRNPDICQQLACEVVEDRD